MALPESSFWILSALAAGRRHGYAILTDVVELSEGKATLKIATLYSGLERLEAEGRIAADGDEIVDGRVRRYYVITDAGAALLAAEAAALEAKARAAARRLAARAATVVAMP